MFVFNSNGLGFWQRILINGLIFLALAGLMPEYFYVANVLVAFVAALILGILNAFVKPFLVLLSLPITFLTLGIFYFIINAFMLELISSLMGSSFHFSSFGVTFLVALIISGVNLIISSYLQGK